MIPRSDPPAHPHVDPGAVALVSGGLDSAVMLARLLEREAAGAGRVYPLYVRQGALWEDAELAALRRFLEALAIAPVRLAPLCVVRNDVPCGYPARWALDPAAEAPGAASPDEAVYLPGRNLMLLLQGALLAQNVGVARVQIGLLRGNPFPDSSERFMRSFETTFEAATGYVVTIEAPLAAGGKAALIREGRALPLEHTFTCLRPVDLRRGDGAAHCGQCNKCAERRHGFAEAGVPDRTDYAG